MFRESHTIKISQKQKKSVLNYPESAKLIAQPSFSAKLELQINREASD